MSPPSCDDLDDGGPPSRDGLESRHSVVLQGSGPEALAWGPKPSAGRSRSLPGSSPLAPGCPDPRHGLATTIEIKGSERRHRHALGSKARHAALDTSGERIVISTRWSRGQAQLPSRWSNKGDVIETRWSRGQVQPLSKWSNQGAVIATRWSRGPVMLPSTRSLSLEIIE